MLTTVAIIVAVALAGFLVFVARKPDIFSIQRTASIKAPPETIFPLIRDFQGFISWSPFEKDPNVKRSFKGPATGKGAIYEWDGNRVIGAGSVEIVDVVPPSKVGMKLAMLRPFKCENAVEFTLEGRGNFTDVTWAMRGRQPFMAKLMGTFMDCEKMCGTQFEEGLAKLKTLAETPVRTSSAA
jgi:Polyketide cyclase / dehydrase and lipid transport